MTRYKVIHYTKRKRRIDIFECNDFSDLDYDKLESFILELVLDKKEIVRVIEEDVEG